VVASVQSGVIGSHAQPAVHSVAVTSSSSQAVAQQYHATVGEEVNGCIAGGDANMTSPSDKHSTASALTAPQTKVALVWHCCSSCVHNDVGHMVRKQYQ